MKNRCAVDKTADCSYITIFGKKIHRAWIILIGCCFLQAGSMGAILGSVGVFYVPVCTELGFARSELSLHITAYFLSSVFALPLAGRIIQKYDLRIVITVSAVACAFAAILCSTYDYVWQWICSGVVYGTFGCCVFQIPAATMLGNWFKKRAGVAMGISAGFASIAAAVLAPFYSYMIQLNGWRFTYLIQGILVVCLILPWSLTVFRLTPAEVGSLPYGWNESDSNICTDTSNASHCEPSGVSVKEALHSVSFVALFIFAGIAVWIGSGFDSHLPSFAESRGLDPIFAALVVTALQLGSFSEKLVMGFVNDKFGVRRTVYIEFAVVSVGILGLMFAQEPWQFLVAAFLFGVQDSFTSISVPLIAREVFGSKNYARIYSWVRTGSGIVGSCAVWLVGLSYDLGGTYLWAFAAALVACVVGSILVAIVYKYNHFSCGLNFDKAQAVHTD